MCLHRVWWWVPRARVSSYLDLAVGRYNRANRSLTHLVETAWTFVLPMVLAGFVYPVPVFVITLVFAYGRVKHATGYTERYGAHGFGFALATLATSAAEGLLLVAAGIGFMQSKLPGFAASFFW